jgi:hypothetical protein
MPKMQSWSQSLGIPKHKQTKKKKKVGKCFMSEKSIDK